MTGLTKKGDFAQDVLIAAGDVALKGDLALPRGASGIVVFVHGSGSSRLSPRNQFVATMLNQAGLGTLLFDLLTVDEERTDIRTARLRFDIDMLAGRVVSSTRWLKMWPQIGDMKIGYFGASTGAAAAIKAAAAMPGEIAAIVSRGGRPDLSGEVLARLSVPTLLVVGGNDRTVLELNEEALRAMPSSTTKALRVVAGASHLFEEPGTLVEASRYACDWFLRYLGDGQDVR